MGNVEFRTRRPLSTWRKIALGSWVSAGDPSVYAILKIDATRILARRKDARTALRDKGTDASVPTLTALVGRACALTMNRYPELNGLIRFGTIYLRKSVTLFFQAAVDAEGSELSGVRIENAESKSAYAISKEIEDLAQQVRAGTDPQYRRVKKQFALVPPLLMRWILDLTSLLIYTFNLDLSKFGVPRDPFGSVMITNVGTLGVDIAFAPLVRYSRVPLLLSVGKINDQPVVRNGKLEVAPVFNLCVTYDHRFIDGVYGAKMIKLMYHYLETDEGLDELGFTLP